MIGMEMILVLISFHIDVARKLGFWRLFVSCMTFLALTVWTGLQALQGKVNPLLPFVCFIFVIYTTGFAIYLHHSSWPYEKGGEQEAEQELFSENDQT